MIHEKYADCVTKKRYIESACLAWKKRFMTNIVDCWNERFRVINEIEGAVYTSDKYVANAMRDYEHGKDIDIKAILDRYYADLNVQLKKLTGLEDLIWKQARMDQF